MSELKEKKGLDTGGKSIVSLMVALLVAIFAFQLNASMLSPALTTTERCFHRINSDYLLYRSCIVLAVPASYG